jgi:hypothetical protein
LVGIEGSLVLVGELPILNLHSVRIWNKSQSRYTYGKLARGFYIRPASKGVLLKGTVPLAGFQRERIICKKVIILLTSGQELIDHMLEVQLLT